MSDAETAFMAEKSLARRIIDRSKELQKDGMSEADATKQAAQEVIAQRDALRSKGVTEQPKINKLKAKKEVKDAVPEPSPERISEKEQPKPVPETGRSDTKRDSAPAEKPDAPRTEEVQEPVVNEIVEDDGNIMSRDDKPNNAGNSMVDSKNTWDLERVYKSSIPRSVRFFGGNYGRGGIVW